MRRYRSSSAKYRKGRGAKYADKLTNDEDDDDAGIFSNESKIRYEKASSELNVHHLSEKCEKELPVAMTGPSVEFTMGGPFSAITKSMWPQTLASKIANGRKNVILSDSELNETIFDTKETYDEFGYKYIGLIFPDIQVDIEGDPEPTKFTHSRIVGELTWDKVDPLLIKCDQLYALVREKGVPHSMRPYVWPRLCGAVSGKKKAAFEYKDLLKAANKDRPSVAKQIEKDLLRTMPSNACFADFESVGVPRMRRILRAIAYLYPDIGYCQGMGVIIGTLLLFVEEEETFWLMITIIEDILPASYFTQSLIGVQADQKVFRQLLSDFLPGIDRLLKEHDIELSLISLNWFLTLFSSVLHVRIVLRVWDLFFYEGSVALFKVALGESIHVELQTLSNPHN
uniref:Rab-GAP TBC domain-containing protein n=1 Tax=Romanomermis culicivorax TaxID=13658 RepID=A0A915KS71_ROMCU